MDALARWLAPDAAPGAYNDWQLVSEHPIEPVRLAGLVALLVLALVASAWGLRRIPWSRRWPLLVLRSLGAVLVAAVLLEPAIELRALSKVRARVAVLVDGSSSMQLATPDGTRAERVRAHVDDNAAAFEALAGRAGLEWHQFDERMRALDPPPWAEGRGPSSEGRRTDLARALDEVSWRGSGRELGAVVLYTDGADTEGLSEVRAASLGERMQVPVYVVGFEASASAPDLAIRRVPTDDFAFVHKPVTLDVELEVHGLDLDQVMVTLEHDGSLVQSKPARFEQGRARLAFEVIPRHIGKQVYEFRVPVQAGEAVRSNNQKAVVLDVIRDRIRVLQVAGRPSWDQRFLRELLERDPSVDLISFFILRSTTDIQRADQDELALIPFPVHELFTEEIDTFDVVIYQNFSYRPYRMDRYLSSVADYVRRGGSFLMVGGNQSFEDGWYSGTPVGDILPLRLGGAMAWDPAPFTPRLTAEGKLHPITRIGDPGEPPDRAYARLPALEGANPSLGLAPGATALLRHPSLPGNPPVVAVREVEDGRVLAVSTDSTWFWRFVAVGDGAAGREYERFWSSALRWMVRDPDLDRVRLGLDRSVVLNGGDVEARVEVLGPDYRPAEGAELRLDITRTDDASSESLPAGRSLVTGPNGTATHRFEALTPGTYRVEVEARMGAELLGRASEPLIVEAADVERRAPFPRPAVGRAIAEASGGTYADISAPLPDIDLGDPRRVEVNRSRRVPIWDGFGVLLLLLLIFGAEWSLRRRAGTL